MKNNTNAQDEFTFETSATGKIFLEEKVNSSEAPQDAALAAIGQAFELQADKLRMYKKENESLGAIIERCLPDIAGDSLKAKRIVIKKYLTDDGSWDKKYISQTLSRIFRKLGEPSQTGGGRKADEMAQAIAEYILEEYGDQLETAELAKKVRNASNIIKATEE
jgi:hypothetical protein